MNDAPSQPIPIDNRWRDSAASNLPPRHIGLFVAIAAREHCVGVAKNFAAYWGQWRSIVDLVRAAKLPAIFPFREYFEIGALMVYGLSTSDVYRRLAGYIDQILKVRTLAICRFTYSRGSSCW